MIWNRAEKHKFRGQFTDKLPNDVGGSGTFTHWESPLGSTSTYMERFRGEDDMVAHMQRRRQAADRIAELIGDWLTNQLRDADGFDRLEPFLKEQLGRDLTNVSYYMLAWEVTHRKMSDAEPAFVIGQYLME